ncbi:MAG TPA: CHAP domain-containing protein [Cyclobacteriaceae bacterium]|nr:CHAP domain-containing protein [Cyclobacteriaceae bacterium]
MNYPNHIIKQGEPDQSLVTAVQKRLMELGVGSFSTFGNYGPKTVAAVKLFQSMHRDHNGNPLEMDGRIGPITWAVLFGPESAGPSVTSPPNPLLDEAVKVARSQIGVMEDPVGSNRGTEVDEYLGSVNCPPGNYWCAGFVYWCFKEAAENLNVKNPLYKTAGCLSHWNNSQGKKISAKTAMENPTIVKPGHIFIIDHGRGMGHTGIIERVDGGFAYTIEGNSNPHGDRNGIGVFQLTRKINKINKGFIEY